VEGYSVKHTERRGSRYTDCRQAMYYCFISGAMSIANVSLSGPLYESYPSGDGRLFNFDSEMMLRS
jgi:hypothetical protein